MAITSAEDVRRKLQDKGFDSRQRDALAEIVEELLNTGASQATSISNLNAWATAFATKLNADATAQNLLNAFPLTLDTNYDTDPQA